MTITVKAHLEYRIGLFSTPLYDFNGKALCKHAPQEMIKLKWTVIGGEQMFHFFSSLAFSLVYFEGLVSQHQSFAFKGGVKLKKGFPRLSA